MPPTPATPASNFRNNSHRVVVLGNLSVSLAFGMPRASPSGSCNATDTTVGDRDDCTSSSLAPEVKPDRRIVLDRSICLFWFLSFWSACRRGASGCRRRTHFNPYRLASKPSLAQASSRTSLRYLPGVVLTVTRRAVVSMTTTCEAIVSSIRTEALQPGKSKGYEGAV